MVHGLWLPDVPGRPLYVCGAAEPSLLVIAVAGRGSYVAGLGWSPCVTDASGACILLGCPGGCLGVNPLASRHAVRLASASSFVRAEEAAGSNPATPTMKVHLSGVR